MGNAFATQEKIEGDKLYAATGLGWDDPQVGWHHCPPGMGLFDEVFVEIRNRVSIHDIFVRNDEIWVEVINDDYTSKNIEYELKDALFDGTHPNAKEYQIIAKYVMQELQNSNIVKVVD